MRCVLPTEAHFRAVLATYDSTGDVHAALAASGLPQQHGSCNLFTLLAAALAKNRGLHFSVRTYSADERGGTNVVPVINGVEYDLVGGGVGPGYEQPNIAYVMLNSAPQLSGVGPWQNTADAVGRVQCQHRRGRTKRMLSAIYNLYGTQLMLFVDGGETIGTITCAGLNASSEEYVRFKKQRGVYLFKRDELKAAGRCGQMEMQLGALHRTKHGKFLSYHNVSYTDVNGQDVPVPGFSNLCTQLGAAQLYTMVRVRLETMPAFLQQLDDAIEQERLRPTPQRELDEESRLQALERTLREVTQTKNSLARLQHELESEALRIEHRGVNVCLYPANEGEGGETFSHEGSHALLASVVPPYANNRERDAIIAEALANFLPTLGPAGETLWFRYGADITLGTGHVEETFTSLMGMSFVAREALKGRDMKVLSLDVTNAFLSYMREYGPQDPQQLHIDLWQAAQEVIVRYATTYDAFDGLSEHLMLAMQRHGW